MDLNILKPRKALNKAYLKAKANRNEIETKTNHTPDIIEFKPQFSHKKNQNIKINDIDHSTELLRV
jgi:hypothetical protein